MQHKATHESNFSAPKGGDVVPHFGLFWSCWTPCVLAEVWLAPLGFWPSNKAQLRPN